MNFAERALPANSGNTGLIYDIGMCACEDTDFYLTKGYRVVAVEANPWACKTAAERYGSEIAGGQLTIVNRAISQTSDPLLFYICRSNGALSTASPRLRDFWRDREGAEFAETVVEGITMAELVALYGVPYYAKIDIEGFDLVCLRGFDECQARPSCLSFEVDFYTVDQMIDCAARLGYRRFALISQKSAPKQKVPRPALEGLDVDYTFSTGSSGLFGRELPTEWMDARGVRSKCAAVVNQHRASGLLRRVGRLLPIDVAKVQAKYFPLACDWYDIHASA
jgi:FkbM family methyltransferase